MLFIKLIVFIVIGSTSLFGAHFINQNHKIQLHQLKQNRALASPETRLIFEDDCGKIYGVGNEIIVCYQKENRKLRQKHIEQKYHLTLIENLSDNMVLYRTQNVNLTLPVANSLSEETGIRFAQPNFSIKKKKRTADPYYKYLWHLKNRDYTHADINVEAAWQYTKGEGVIGAVIDEGIDIDHDDLRANIIGFANYNNPESNYPSSGNGTWHGTACAGLIAAVENDTGVVGVAPASKIYAIRYSEDDIAQDIKAFRDLMRAGVSVISNSWGSYSNLDAYNEIFKELATKGRNGKGILIFFAAGNDHLNLDDPGIDDESESPYVISVSASTERDGIAPYANYGSSVDFLAPGGSLGGELVTTDATGEKGYTDWNYNFNFVGTSAAAPIAAGVAMLILSENPDLTRDEVIEIMRRTAVKIGEYPYDANGRNDYAGYGRIDAGRAVALAHRYKLKALGIQSRIDNFAHVIFKSVQTFSNQ